MFNYGVAKSFQILTSHAYKVGPTQGFHFPCLAMQGKAAKPFYRVWKLPGFFYRQQQAVQEAKDACAS